MAVDWSKMWDTQLTAETFSESLGFWKLSNVTGWYMSNYGFIKTQLMLGLERKINMAAKYEWYYSAPTKVLMYGENKIDMKEYQKASPTIKYYGLTWMFAARQSKIETFEKDLKAAKENKAIAGPSSTTCVGHTLNVTAGDSTETINAGNKEITVMVGGVMMSAMEGVTLMQSEASWLEVTAAGCKVNAPIINLG